MPEYGEIRVDYITYTTGTSPNEGQGTVTVSGLINNPTFSGNVIIANDLTVSGKGIFASGTASTPSITFIDDLNTGIYSPAANELAISTGGTGRVFIDDSGNVGIGTSSPQGLLDVKKDNATGEGATIAIRNTGSGAGTSVGLYLAPNNAAAVARAAAIKSRQAISGNYADLGFFTAASDTPVERMTIAPNGNVGIGTIDPQSLLHLSASSPRIEFTDTDTGADHRVNADSSAGNLAFDCDFNSETTSPSVVFNIKGGEKLRIKSDGNVGIGTSTPQEILTVNGNIEFATSYRISSGSGDRGNVQISSPNEATTRSVSFGNNYYINSSGTWVQPATNVGGSALELRANNGDYGQILFRQKQDPDAGGAERIPFFIQTNGNVGIGTSSPGYALTVGSASPTFGRVAQFNSSTADSLIGFGTSGGTGENVAEIGASTSDLVVNTQNNERLRISSNGNVGIGTSSPSTVLHIAATAPRIRIEDSDAAGTPYSEIRGDSGNLFYNANQNAALGGDHIWSSGGASNELMRIDSSGNVGIGTSDPRSLLDVKKVNNAGEGATIAIRNTGSGIGTSVSLYLVPNNGGGDDLLRAAAIKSRQAISGNYADLGFFTAASDTPVERMTIAPNGNVGIGTSSPGSLLNLRLDSSTAFDATEDGGQRASTASLLIQNEDGTNGSFSQIVFDTAGTSQSIARIAAIRTANGSNDLAFVVEGSNVKREAMRITSNGNVGIGTNSPVGKLEVIGIITGRVTDSSTGAELNSAGALEIWRSGANAFIDFKSSANEDYDCRIQQQNNGLAFSTGGNGTSFERMRIDSSGRLLVGTSSARANFNNLSDTTKLQIEGTGFVDSSLSILRTADNNASGGIIIAKNRSTSVGGNGQVNSGDSLGKILFEGQETDSGNNKFIQAAKIEVYVDGTPGANDMPGRLVFSTTADGASSPTERMRISNDGQTYIVGAGTSLSLSNTAVAGTTVALIAGRHSATAGTPGSGALSFVVYTNGNVQNTNNSYGAISDVKLKENIVDANSQWDDLKALQVRNYNFKEGQTHTQIGVVAQEVELISPGLVTESPDRDEDGNDLGTVTKSVNYSVLYMKAVKALQEAMERIEALEQRLADAGL